MTSVPDKTQPPDRRQAWLFPLIGLATSLIAFLPGALIFHRLWTAGLCGLLGAVLFTFAMNRIKPPLSVPYRPRAGEYLLFSIETMFTPALSALWWLILYILLYAVMWVIRWLIALFFPGLAWNVATTSFWISYVTVVFFFCMAIAFVREQYQKLYPNVAGLKSDYFPKYLLLKRRLPIYVAAIASLLILPILLFAALGWGLNVAYIYVTIMLPFLTSLAIPAAASLPKSVQEIVISVGELYRAAGYEVSENPRTDDPKVDPLLMEINYYATKDGRSYLIDVVPKPPGDQPIAYNDLFTFKQAVWSYCSKQEISPEAAIQQVVLVDIPADDKLIEITKSLGIDIILLGRVNIARVLSQDPADPGRKKAASQFLRAQREQGSGPQPAVARVEGSDA